MRPMTKREIETGEYPVYESGEAVADGALSRGKALKAVGAAFLGGLLSIFALPSRDAEAARRRLLKTLWAVVAIKADLTPEVTRSKGAVSSSKFGTGVYKIGFNRDVSGCACVAAVDQSQVGFVSPQVNSIAGTKRDVIVSTYDTDGTAADLPFQLVVHC
jgi:hypothetical protein